jgi:organic radical activating enzyme
MAINNSVEEREMMKLIDHLPVADEEKQTWTKRIRDEGLSEELVEEIQKKLTPDEDSENNLKRVQHTTEVSRIAKRWRLTKNLQHR